MLVPVKQVSTIFLRFLSLVAKLGLTLYMGRYFSLEDLGLYGLVMGAASLLSTVLGMQTEYVVSRELVTAMPAQAVAKIRDQSVFLFLNWVVFALCLGGMAASFDFGLGMMPLLFIFLLSCVESAANIVHVHVTSMGNPLRANLLFFVRAGSWAIPVMILGFFFKTLRDVSFVFSFWFVGVALSVLLAFWFWRGLPWASLQGRAIDWGWLKGAVRRSFGVWLGVLGLSAGAYLDRFVVLSYLGLDYVGIAAFYFSFGVALLTLVHSGVLAFAYPRMIKYHKDGEQDLFWHEIRHAAWQVALFAAAIGLVLGFIVPFLGPLFGKPEFMREAPTLWLMLLALWVRSNSETLYFILFARHQDRPVWVGNVLFLIPAFGCNLVFVPMFGLIGVGMSALVAAVFLFFWRAWFVWTGSRAPV